MNYSTDSRNKLEKKNKSNAKRIKKKGKITAFRIIIMAIIIGMFAIVGGGLGVFIGIIKSAPDASMIDLRPQGNYTSFVYDDAGNEIATFAPSDNREYAKLSEIPLHLQQAVIATEDERFYEHNGIDIKGIFRALVANIQSGHFSEGASTITQQLVKNNVLSSDKKLTRKIQEQYLAIQFEKYNDKDTILEYYLNTIGLSQGVTGVQAASKLYFDKEVSELSLAESVVLAVITQWPTKYDPILHPENNKEKAHRVLDKMEEQGFITAEEHQAALNEDPYANIKHETIQEKSKRSYFVDALFYQLVDDLQDLGYTEAQAKKKIYGGGLKIYSTMNSQMQNIADSVINDPSFYPDNLYKVQVDYSIAGTKADGTRFEHSAPQVILKNNEEVENYIQKMKDEWGITSTDKIIAESKLLQPQPQASFVLTDFTTGQIKALVGGRGDKTNLGFNYATQAKRQPGSTFKILAAYAPALDTGLLSPGSLIKNERVSFPRPNASPYEPKNWDNIYDDQYYSVRDGIANSMNILAVKTLNTVGIETSFDYLHRFGFTTLVDDDKYLPLALGGLTDGVTALELNAAYGAIANDGMYVKPTYYTTVIDTENNNKVLIDNTGEHIANNSHRVIETSTARMLTDMMVNVIDYNGKHTGGSIRTYLNNMAVAGKTGTTTSSKDLLFAGYTPYYAATIWTGYSQPEEISSANGGSSYHLKIWSKIMSEIHSNLEYKSFPKVNIDSSSSIQEVLICTKSGKLATDACKLDPDHCIASDYVSNSHLPTEYCDIHEEVKICKESGKIATEFCPETTTTLIIKTDANSSSAPTEICDIHMDPTTTFPDDSLLPGDDFLNNGFDENENGTGDGVNNGFDNGNNNDDGDWSIPITPPDNNQNSNSTPNQTPIEPPTNLPPVVDQNPPPSIDDESDFAIPQY